MSSEADFIIVAVKYDDEKKYITHVKQYKRNGHILDDIGQWTRAGVANLIKNGKICVTAVKNPLSKWSLGKIRNGNYF